MVLQDLGEKILESLQKLSKAKAVDDTVFKSVLREIVNALRAADVSNDTVFKFMKEVQASINLAELPPGMSAKKIIESRILEELVSMIDPKIEPYKPVRGRPNVFMMVGLQGSGKTTTCTKLAHFYKRDHWKTAVVGADTFRAGAREQLLANAQQVDVDCYVDFVNQDPVEVAITGVRKFKHEHNEIIIVDTSGRHMQEEALFQEMTELEAAVKPDEVIFVLDGTLGQSAFAQAQAFAKCVSVGSIIITKLDSSAKGGGALSAVAATGSPIAFYGNGEGPDSLELFHPQSFISRILGYGDSMALIQKLKRIDVDQQQELMTKMMNGHYGFREMKAQFQMITEMGSISELLNVLGMSKFLPKGASQEDMNTQIKKVMIVIDSMTETEKDQPELLRDEKRLRRMARGTGCTIEFIKFVLDQQKQWKTAFSRLPASTRKLFMSGDMQNQNINPRTMQREMTNLMNSLGANKQMLKQLGGGNLDQLMKMASSQLGGLGMPKRR